MPGKYFEEFEVGHVFEHQPGRTVTEPDNLLFNSIFTLGLIVGLSVGDTTLGTTVGNLGFERVEFPKPVFIGDTIRAVTEVVGKRESKSHPEWGIVTFEHRGLNQRDEVVARCSRAAMMLRKA